MEDLRTNLITNNMNDRTENEDEYTEINKIYDECLSYLKEIGDTETADNMMEEPDYATIKELTGINKEVVNKSIALKFENELKSTESLNSVPSETKSERLRKLSQQLPKIIITQSTGSLDRKANKDVKVPIYAPVAPKVEKKHIYT